MNLGKDDIESAAMDGPLISVVVPVYNVEAYLEECVRSLLRQTYNRLEIILVDDGSSDLSSTICDEFAECDDRVFVCHKRNGGLSDARNHGISLAHGAYLSFIDGDDYLEAGAYEAVVAELESGADIVIFGIELNYCDGRAIKKASNIKRSLVGDQGIVELNTFRGLDVSACNKVYKRSLFEGIEFPVGKHCEDFYIMPKLLDRSSHIIVLPDVFYHYRQRAGSITKGSFFPMDYIHAAEAQLEYVSDVHPDLVSLAQGALGFAHLTHLNYCIRRNLEDEAISVHRKVRQYWRIVVLESRFPLWKRLQYCFACGSLHVYRFIITMRLEGGSK